MPHPPVGLRALHSVIGVAAACLALRVHAQADPSQTIVVTAARAEQRTPDALPSTRVIMRPEIESTPAPDLPSLLRQLTSIDVAQTGPLGSQASLFLRGSDSRQVLVLVDGVPFARADFGTASWQALPLEQIERIEIVRGNHSALYGAQAIGGVVQIITRRALAPQVTLGAGTQGTRLASAAAGTAFGEGTLASRVSLAVSARHSEGFSARDLAQDPGANPDLDPVRQHAASAFLEQGWAAGHRTRLALSSSRTSSAYDGFMPGLDDVIKTRVQTLALTSRHALTSDWSLDAEVGQTRERFDDPNGFTTQGDNRVRNLNLTLGWQVLPGHNLQLGAESRRDRYSEPAVPARRRSTDSVRLGWQGRVGAAWQMQAHARSDRSSAFGSASTGLLALGYEFAPGWKASLQASSGFSAPSFLDELFADPGVTLKPERSRQAEAAVQWRRGAASLRAAWFVQRQRDRIGFDPVSFTTVNIARARNQGLEVIAQQPIDGIGSLSAEVTLQDPRDTDSDTPLKRRARHSLALGWQDEAAGWSWRAGLRYTGRRLDTDPQTFGNADNAARTTLSLGLARQLMPGWRLSLALDNAADSRRPEVLGYTAPPRSALLSLQATLK